MLSVKVKNVCKNFGKVEVIKNIDIDIEPGEFVVFVGPSGCGKSTLLRMIAGLEDVTSGQVFIEGKDVTYEEPSKHGIAMVFQSYALYPHMTVEENIGFSLSLAKLPKKEIKQKVLAAAEALQLVPLLKRKPKALSGGQRQRVAIGRAIVRDPKVFLFDEPLSNLDASLRAQMRVEIADLHSRLKTTMIYVTHDQVEAMTLADKIVILNAGEIEQIGSPIELYEKPATPFVAGFIGSPKMNLYEGEFAKSMDCVTYGIRPEHIELSETAGQWHGRIHLVERLGADSILHIDVESVGNMIARVEGNTSFEKGAEVWLSPREGKEHKFLTPIIREVDPLNRSVRKFKPKQ